MYLNAQSIYDYLLFSDTQHNSFADWQIPTMLLTFSSNGYDSIFMYLCVLFLDGKGFAME